MTEGYRQKCLSVKGEVCDICDSEENVVVHHKDGDRTNNDIENLIPLCEQHHKKVHAGSADAPGLINALPAGDKENEPVTVTVKVPKYRKNQLEAKAARENTDRSTVIRELIDNSIAETAGDSERELRREMSILEREKAVEQQKAASESEKVALLKSELEATREMLLESLDES